jgi:hypothetical protein
VEQAVACAVVHREDLNARRHRDIDPLPREVLVLVRGNQHGIDAAPVDGGKSLLWIEVQFRGFARQLVERDECGDGQSGEVGDVLIEAPRVAACTDDEH